MLQKKTWVVVANTFKARVFSFSKGSLARLAVITRLETRKQGYDLGIVARSPNEAEHFAKEVAQYLDLEYRMNQFHHLHIIASPAFLGLLKHRLHAETQKSVLTEVDKNLVEEGSREIRNYLPQVSLSR